MRLKRLELTGFKSFASRVRLEFDAGITAIVGPNGSGKSNISDSVRWILGEQSVKSLRGSKLEDIIFSGTDGKRPLGMAEVQLTLDNSDGFLPVDFKEVVVARRVYRSGESDFLINKRPCRLRDIQDLFTDTGLGREGYAVIGQNQFDMILSVNPKERRVIFEETAGIVRYKNRKEQAVKKIEQTEQDLVRIQDILAEVERQIEPLREEAAKTRRYRELDNDLREFELDLFCYRVKELQASQAALRDKAASASCRCATLSEEYQQLDNEIQSKETEQNQLDEAIDQAQASLMDVSERLASLQRQIELDAERQRSAVRSMERLKETQRVQQEKTDALRRQIHETQEAVTLKEQAASRSQEELETVAGTLKQLRLHQQTSRETLEERKNGFLDFMRELSDARNVRQNHRERMTALQVQMQRLQKESTEAQEKSAENQSVLDETKTALEASREAVSSLDAQKRLLVQEQKELAAALEEARRKENSAQDELRQTQSRLRALTELEDSYEGFYQSVRRVLKAKLPQVELHGTVADVLTVPRTLETALEIALGPGLQNIIAATQEDAQKAIGWLKKEKAGRGTFLPLDTIKGREFPESYTKYWESRDSVLGPALDLVSFAPEYRPALASLLGRVALAKDLPTAVELAETLPSFGRIVTIDGDVIMPSGAMTGGSTAGKTKGILSRKNEIKELQSRTAQGEKQLRKRQSESRCAEDALSANRAKERQLEEERSRAEKEQSSLERRIYELTLEGEHLVQAADASEAERRRLAQESEELRAAAESAAKLLCDMESREATLRKTIADLEVEVEHNDGQLVEYQELVAHRRVEHTEAVHAVERLQERRAEFERQHQEARQQLEQAKREWASLAAEQEEREGARSRREAEAEARQSERDQLRKESDAKKGRRSQLQSELQCKTQRLRKLRSELTSAERRMHALELEKGRIDDSLDRINEDLKARDVSVDAVLERSPDATLGELEEQVSRLHEEVRSLGAVHPGAVEEYDALVERQSFLHGQMQDLNEAKASLRAVIEEMDETSKKRFRKTFSQLRQEFQRLFSQLFMGGRADLVLVEPESPLTSGVEIVAQPPGKKLQNLLLLSGGERALTAIALLFAILSVRPAPFCVFDEVDSALDEANLDRFAQVMKQFSADIQFLVITHRRGTMEAADRLYGLTMTDSAVSQLMSVSLA